MISFAVRVRKGLTKKMVSELGPKRRVDILSEWEKRMFQVEGIVCAKTEGIKAALGETRQCCLLQHSLLKRSNEI